MIEVFECPNCGTMLDYDDLEEGYCNGCGMILEVEDAA